MNFSALETDLTSFFASPALLSMAAAIYFILMALDKYILPDILTINKYYKRLQPIFPELLGFGATFLHAYAVPKEFKPWVLQHIVVGLFLGAISSKAHKIVEQSLMGKDKDIVSTKATKPDADTSNNG